MKLHALQYMRAIASLAVVYSHAVLQVPAYQAQLHDAGSFGVDIFFVISGFIMVYIARPNDTPVRFMSNRIRRVVPLYWFFTLLMAAILLVAPTLFKTSAFDIPIIIKSLLFIPHYSQSDPTMVWPLVAPGWSLVFEMYFYLLFAASLWLPRHLRLLGISLCIVSVFMLARLLPVQGAVVEFFRDTIVFEFVFGMVLAALFLRGLRLPSTIAWCLLIAGFALLFWDPDIDRLYKYGLPALMIVTGTVYCRIPNWSFFVLLGDSSYALYLVHIFTLGVCRKVLPPLLGDSFSAAILFVILSLILCTVCGLVTHFAIDNWLLRQGRMNKLQSLRERLAIG